MNRKQLVLTLFVAVISGSLGGALSVWFLMPPSVLAQGGPQKVIEAQEFRVVDGEGNNRGILGIKPKGEVGLYLLDSMGNSRTELSAEAEGGGVIAMRDKTGLAAFMVIGVESSGKLGAGLMFTRDEYQTALGPLGLGFTKGKTKLEIDIQKDAGPSLSLTDSLGMVRAVLGPTELKNTRTGSTEIRAPSSLVLFDEEGNVVWSAP